MLGYDEMGYSWIEKEELIPANLFLSNSHVEWLSGSKKVACLEHSQ